VQALCLLLADTIKPFGETPGVWWYLVPTWSPDHVNCQGKLVLGVSVGVWGLQSLQIILGGTPRGTLKYLWCAERNSLRVTH